MRQSPSPFLSRSTRRSARSSTTYAYTDGAEQELHKQISELRASIGLASHSGTAAGRAHAFKGTAETGSDGHRGNSITRGPGSGTSLPYVPPPARGITESSTSSSFASLINRERRASQSQSQYVRTPKFDFPHFDGENPKFWQARCEDYFALCDTDPAVWIAVAAMQFEGPAARWLSSVQHKFERASWQEFSTAVVQRFGQNQHQTLVRRLYRLRQTDSVEDYILEFSALMDQLAAYEPNPDMMHYTYSLHRWP